jgi:predicted component of type VI protein secretion system
VRPARRPRRLLLAAVEWLSELDADLQAAWARPRVPSLALPRAEGRRHVVGRAASCDCVVPEECVSRRHAQVWRDGGRWFLRDLGSRNGTRVNGLRVIEPLEVRPGDRVSLGGATYRLRARV